MSLFRRLVIGTLPLAPRFLVRRVAAPYVAGETLAEAVDVVRALNAEGAMATVDVLGEAVTDRAHAEAVVDEYLGVFRVIESDGLDANVSIKLTLLGLDIDEDFCRDNVERLAIAAKELGNNLRIDMEDRTTTDATLRIYRQLHARYGNLGCVLQAYMRRTLDDLDELPEQGPSVRLCKGIYVEPRTVAWKGYETVRRNFVAALDKMLRKGIYAAIATHDEYLVCAAEELLERHGVARDRYEFQMLLGVDDELRRILIDRGHRLRVYVPYGEQWFEYSTRRVRENPQIAVHAARAFLGLAPAGES